MVFSILEWTWVRTRDQAEKRQSSKPIAEMLNSLEQRFEQLDQLCKRMIHHKEIIRTELNGQTSPLGSSGCPHYGVEFNPPWKDIARLQASTGKAEVWGSERIPAD
jgi:hypothetical protein